MLKKDVTYTDYNGVERTESFFFNLSEAELTEMELGTAGGFTDKILAIIKAKDVPSLIILFKDIVLKSYGEKSIDGKRFMKSKEISEAFSQTEAYVQIYMELVQDDQKAADFVNGILPKKLRDRVEENKNEVEKMKKDLLEPKTEVI